MRRQDTIFALATPPGKSGIAVLRLSGPEAHVALGALLAGAPMPGIRRASLRRLFHPETDRLLDEAMVIRFAPGASFTGEASVELHCHGGRATVSALLDALGALPGLRLAEPGEFTRRAFDAGRLDLAQIEGLADLVAADTEAQRLSAMRAYEGSLGELCRGWSQGLTRGLALLEATIDFADEDIPEETWRVAATGIAEVESGIAAALERTQVVERLHTGWRVAIIGAPNAGKSSLINALSRRDIAITSPIAGTTRDSIEVALDIGGYPVTLIDTAGLRDSDDEIERAGVARARSIAEAADLRIAVMSSDAPLQPDALAMVRPGDLRLWNKADISASGAASDLSISAVTGAGIDSLISIMRGKFAESEPSEDSLVLRQRHDAALRESLDALGRFRGMAGEGGIMLSGAPELAAEEARVARAALGRITGETGVEGLLDVIFSEFCLGK